jgi:Tfp pilus assembly protein PilO
MSAVGIPLRRTLGAVALLALALGVHFLWFAPQLRENRDLRETQERLARQIQRQHQLAAQNRAFVEYVTADVAEGPDWVTSFRQADPFSLLDGIRRDSGLTRRDLRLQDQETEGPFRVTSYFLSLHGTYEQALTFLRSVEEAMPVMVLDSFVVEQASEARRVNLRVTVFVYTLGTETAS